MMRNTTTLQLVLTLKKTQRKKKEKMNGVLEVIHRKITTRTFSFRCSTSTTPANATIAPRTVAPTQGIHCPGRKYSSLCHSSGVAPGLITSFELGMTISSAATRLCVAPANRFSM
jgi:hypothetical protein